MTAETIQRPAALRRFLYKACARCGGDLTLSEEHGSGWSEDPSYVCLQCGRHTSISDAVNARREPKKDAA